MPEMKKQYDPKTTEDDIYRAWEESGAFIADHASGKSPYAISMPPPNATGELHVGHALFVTLEDILIRTARMQGKEAFWLPGTDHAAIATESVVIRALKKEGMRDPRQELGRERLVEKIAQFVESSQGTIRSQIRKIGASCDWSRERYTLDPSLNRCVTEVFTKMYNDGVIYRGNRLVNWDPNLQTTVSDDELEWQEERTPFYTFKYGPFEIGTARPETKFGDKYVVMHPDDERYSQYKHGDTFTCEWINGEVTATIIKDEAVDPAFGTGVMTITPWHDAVDFEIAERHNLDKEQIIDFDGTLLPVAKEFAGMRIQDARTKIVDKLKAKGLLIGTDENYTHRVAINSRGKGTIEPQIKLQWFVDVNKKALEWKGEQVSLKEVMQRTVRDGDISIYPQRFEKVYFNWIDNLRDWCISRQIWWGHRIPVWYKGEEVYAGVQAPEGDGWQQDEDTLDTWFSSALWTWSTLIDPALADDYSLSLPEILAKSPDFKAFHPTAVMETGHDLIFFWVARMILMTTYATGQVPFKDVFLHGLVTASGGKKMSKSDPSTAIDPLQMIEEYGADALRFGLVYQMSYGSQLIKFNKQSVQNSRNFANKIWNIGRFIKSLPEREEEESVADRWIRQRLQATAGQVTQLLAAYKFGEAARALYDFVWKDFADWYVEIVKVEGSTKVAKEAFADTLLLLHPFMPFITEKIWSKANEGMLMHAPWPDSSLPAKTDKNMEYFQDVVSTVRSIRALLTIAPGAKVSVYAKEVPMPAAFQALCRAEISEETTPAMRLFPLQSGKSIYVASEEITEESISRARETLQSEQQAVAGFIEAQEKTVENMKGKAPKEKIKEKEVVIAESKDRLEEIKRSLKALA